MTKGIKTRTQAETLIAIGMIKGMTGTMIYSSDIWPLPKKTWYRNGQVLRYQIVTSGTTLTDSQADIIRRAVERQNDLEFPKEVK